MIGSLCVAATALAGFAALGAEMPEWNTIGMTNPLVTDEGTWTAAGQTEKDPLPTAEMKPLAKGMRFDKDAWQWDNGRLAVMGRNLVAMTLDNKAQVGPATAVLFQPRKAGKYSVRIQGVLKIQIPAAGHALASAFVLRAGGSAAEELGAFTTVDATTKRGVSQVAVSLEKEVAIEDGDRIAVRVQARNPGNANAGNAYLTLETFSVSPAAVK